ncbi:MAG: GDP-mannose 4,6-dehydratase, partial [Ktedonobacterales bacterium]
LFGLSNDHEPRAGQLTTVTGLHADITKPEQVRAAVAEARPDLIFHLAAQPSVALSWADPSGTLAINAGGAVHLCEALRAERMAPRVVFVGSGEQYGLVRPEENPVTEACPPRPVNPYAVSKATQDLYGYLYFTAYGLPIMRARPFNHFGPGQAETFVIAGFARQIALIEAGLVGPELAVGNLRAKRDFLPVTDVVRAYVAIAERGQPGESYNVGSGHARAISEILSCLLDMARVPIQLREDPARFRPVDVPMLYADTSHLRAGTGWEPVEEFERVLAWTLDYWRAIVTQENPSVWT